MKPDGVTMEITETTEAAAVAEPSNPLNATEQSLPPLEEATGDGAPKTAAAVNGKAATKPTAKKQHPTTKTESASGSRATVTSRRPVNDVKPSNNVASRSAPVKKPLAPSTRPHGAATEPKKTQAGSSGTTSTAKTQVKLPDKKPSGPASAATAISNGTKPANGPSKKTLATARPKTTGPVSRPMGTTAPKPGASTATKPDASTQVKTSRPATAPPTSRTAAKPSTAAATTKPASTVRTTTSRAATAPPSGRSAAALPNKATGPAKKDVSRPPAPAAAVAKKPPPTVAAAKRTEVSKPAGNVKPSMASATTKVDSKLQLPPKPQQMIKPNATKKPAVAAARFPAVNRVGQTPPGSPSAPNTTRSKVAHKPTQAVSPFTGNKKTGRMGPARAAAAATNKAAPPPGPEAPPGAAVAAPPTQVPEAAATAPPPVAVAAVVQEMQVEPVTTFPQEQSSPESSTDLVAAIPAQGTELETVEKETEKNTDSAPVESPLRTALPQIEQQPPCVLSPSAPQPAPAASPLQPENISPVDELQMVDLPKPMLVSENDCLLVSPPNNLNEDEEEEEKEGSQLVSVSEMSGTTQPTEESHPGSAGPVGASGAWRVGSALPSELDSEEVSVSQHGASELSAPGVLEGTESLDDLGEGSLKGAMDMEGASAGSPDFERVPEIPVNDYDDEDEDDNDRVCDMDVGSERADEPQRHDNDVDDEEDEDVEMASEGVTESGLESYGNADEDDFAEDERLDNLNRVVELLPPPPLIPSAPAAQWDQPNPFCDPWSEPVPQQPPPEADSQTSQAVEAAAESPLTDPCQGDSETPTQESTRAWMELCSATVSDKKQEDLQTGEKEQETPDPQMCLGQPELVAEPTLTVAAPCTPGSSPLRIISSETTLSVGPDSVHSENDVQASPQLMHREEPDGADELPASASNPSSSSETEDEASDTEGEAQLEESLETLVICNVTFDNEPQGQRCLSIVEEGEEPEDCCAAEDATPPSATSQVSCGFDTTTSASNSNAQSTGESCMKSPGIFSLDELPEEAKEPVLTHLPPALPNISDHPYIECREQHADSEHAVENEVASPDKVGSPSPESQEEQLHPLVDLQPPYYSAICEKTENFAGFTTLLHPQRRDHSSYPRTYCDIVKPVHAALASPKLSCTDLPPRSHKQQSLSPQLRRLEQHQRHLQELQLRREQQSRPMEEAEQERKRREEEEERKKKDEAEEEIKRNKEQERRQREQEMAKKQELQQRKDLELQLHQQQEELQQRQQLMQWQQELQVSNKGQPLLLSPSSGLCTIYEALEQDDEEATCEEEIVNELNSTEKSSETCREVHSGCGRVTPETHPPPPPQNTQQRLGSPTQNGDSSSPAESPERPSPLDLEWGKNVDIVHQLINHTLLLNGDGCSSLLLLPGGAGGTLSPLESSLWPTLLPPLTPPSATVTSVSSFSPETSGTSSQGEWTVVELETHH
ncbi:uncharacterized protein prr36a [Eucyclogobius newberryi]|uniref:uncharacterized protein prr36a n=1 Tax=Eucyclogobius newberryi TaxID=166745 RepID=UPI003B590405